MHNDKNRQNAYLSRLGLSIKNLNALRVNLILYLPLNSWCQQQNLQAYTTRFFICNDGILRLIRNIKISINSELIFLVTIKRSCYDI